MSLRWEGLVTLDDERLGRLDVAAVHLACAAGLPGGPTPAQVTECLDRLDHYARCVADYTQRAMPTFEARPGHYQNSEGKFWMVCLVRVLQTHFGVLYNEAKIPEHVPLGAADTFLHGALLGEGGTCASLPVVYAAVGRRIGYPLKLVSTSTATAGHLFVRWEGMGERFNFEANNTSSDSPSDEYFRNHPQGALSPEAERQGLYLISKTPRHELSGFMAERGFAFLGCDDLRRATNAFVWAWSLMPADLLLRTRLRTTMRDWRAAVMRRMWPTFPWTTVTIRRRRFPESVPLDTEREVCTYEGWEQLLNTPDLERHVWEPMRRGVPGRWPTSALIVSDGDGYEIGLRHEPYGGVVTT